ncbi:hypothetical protein CAOG_009746 [Capsaspora owczarzaki ATCC 30864]|uniref:EXPERA domain-containing protein n=2 Tax=Capsaspora owczarzaki (strain ATCC 30864) TaxID=595528 RepID=A0A0D2UDY4_CAPO3|nr:hypothetical protein CAOG_009746 [Capsaspora owczarzaki ATCC 30864]
MLRIALLLYFLSHIPISILIDFQAILPRDWFPKFALDATAWYTEAFGDYLLANPPQWYKSFIWIELIFQLPFFFVAFYGILTRKAWIRSPLLIYGAHVVTTVTAIVYEAVMSGKLTQAQLPWFLAIYAPYFFLPLSLVFLCSCSNFPVKAQDKKVKNN